jgi:hypothetical protein
MVWSVQKNGGNDFYNQNFINLKIDMEKGEGVQLAQKYSVRAYPTLLFVDEAGKLVANAVGGRQSPQFIDLGKNALNKYDKSGEYAAQYEAGDRSQELLRKYAYALLGSKKEHLKIANEYFKGETNLTTEENLKAIFDFATEADSRVFDLLLEHKTAIIALKSETLFAKKVENACMQTVKKAAEFEVPTLLDDAKNKMKKAFPANKAFPLQADQTYALAMNNVELYLSASKKYLSKFAKTNYAEWDKAAMTVLAKFPENESAVATAEKWAKTAANRGNLSDFYLHYAKILFQQNKTDAAIEAANKAKTLAAAEQKDTRMIDDFLNVLKKA